MQNVTSVLTDNDKLTWSVAIRSSGWLCQPESEFKMIDISKLSVGQRVYYQPAHYKEGEFENGLIKEIPEHTTEAVRVVYNCNGDWNNYKNYTSALTRIKDLKLGWKHKEIVADIEA